MAIYYPTVTKQNYIGGVSSNVQVLEPEATAIAYNEFVSNAAASNLVLDSIDIYSYTNDLAQVSQPVVVNHIQMDGTTKKEVYVPNVSSLSFNSQVKDVSFETPFLFNGLSNIEYPVIANSTVSIKLVAKKPKKDRKLFPDTDYGRDEINFKAVLSKGSEPEEIKPTPIEAKPIAEISEPGEEKKPVKEKKKKKTPEIKEVKPLNIEDTVEEVNEYVELWAEDADNVMSDMERFELEERNEIMKWDLEAEEAIKQAKIKKIKSKPKKKPKKEVDKDLVVVTKWDGENLIWDKYLMSQN